MLKEFKEFVMRGNVLDMAVGVIIGGAFGKIVSSLVGDIIMPPVGLLLGNADFSNLAIVLKEGSEGVAPVALKYGVFINTVLDFVIIAFAIFMVIRAVNRFRRQEPAAEPAPATTKECPKCFSTINIKAIRCPACTSELGE